MNQAYELNLGYFQGPFEKLLGLIEEKQLEISQVSLAAVTADFLGYLENLEAEKIRPELLADFVGIASKLILIKSKSLLPALEITEEEDWEMRDLERKLRFFQEFKAAREHIRNNWQEMPVMATREYLSGSVAIFYPPGDLKPAGLQAALTKLVEGLKIFFKPAVALKNEIVSLKKKIEDVFRRLTAEAVNFQSLHSGQSKSEAVVLFLAILHLLKDQLIRVDQDDHFGEMRIAKMSDA